LVGDCCFDLNLALRGTEERMGLSLLALRSVRELEGPASFGSMPARSDSMVPGGHF
jgi:hypothetical protein